MKLRAVSALLAACGLLALSSPCAVAADTAALRLYEITTETGMPHLEANLRYAVVQERRCMSRGDLSQAFWMLQDVSLQDCRLIKAMEEADEATYRLQCEGGHGTSGDARWRFEGDAIAGTLKVRLGGKNMTFFQRITGRPIGDCD